MNVNENDRYSNINNEKTNKNESHLLIFRITIAEKTYRYR